MEWIMDSLRLLARGGYVMIPLMLCSIISVAVLIERHIKVAKAHSDVSEVVHDACDAIYERQFSRALLMLESHDTAVTRVLAAGLRSRHLGERSAERAMEERGTRETSALTRHLGILDTIITIAPLLGLLGTVTGMMSSFHVMAATSGIGSPTAITGGVGEALLATATGLAIAIVTLVGHNHLQEQIKQIVADIEARGTAMVNVFVEVGEVSSEVKSLSA